MHYEWNINPAAEPLNIHKEKPMRLVTSALLLLLFFSPAALHLTRIEPSSDFGAKLSDSTTANSSCTIRRDGVSYYNYVGACRLQVHLVASRPLRMRLSMAILCPIIR
jgi:hypothetical protein